MIGPRELSRRLIAIPFALLLRSMPTQDELDAIIAEVTGER